ISFWIVSDYQQLYLPNLLLDQLLINAMLNAQQQGAQHIILRCTKASVEDKSWLAISITDDAGGFDESHIIAHQSALPTNNPQY
ncbi:hypothetical protein, partial [Psychrobacter sp. CAL346-MNA-CIBAN-0220]|uniref:hypothetical protein n=1 Tax=Psychrobacter sp. CAL346-MNA-CIBAN-0220 TaxID=3140457 RepID=UPI00331E6BBB